MHDFQNFPAGLVFLSSRTFSGSIKPNSQFVSILGSQHIKIRKADLSKKRTDLEIVTLLGETVIYVEPGIQVNNKTIPILGGSWTDKKIFKQSRDDEPEINISGVALLGNITVKPLRDKQEH